MIVQKDGGIISLDNDISAQAGFTSGHNPSCITCIIEDCPFTEDTFMPGMKTVTKLHGCNKLQVQKSLKLIKELAEGWKIYPGHKV